MTNDFENNLPAQLKKYFWDVEFDKLDLSRHKKFILGRLLLFGDLYAIKFVSQNYKLKEVKDFLNNNGKQLLDSKSFNFWNILIQHTEIWVNENI